MSVTISLALIAVAGGSYVLTSLSVRALLRFQVLDFPGYRSMHRAPTVRGAGVAMVVSWVAAAIVALAVLGWAPAGLQLVLLVSGLSLVGLIDDLHRLSPFVRLIAQIVIVAVGLLNGLVITQLSIPGIGDLNLAGLALPICVFGVVLTVNLFNFMDGIDGLVAAQTAVSAAIISFACFSVDERLTGTLAACLGAVAIGFLPFNWNPARCFMGDVGSYFCGAAFAGTILLAQHQGIPVLLGALSAGPFLADGIITLISRVVRRERFWQPHRNHFYQRLVLGGWHPRAVTTLYVVAGGLMGTTGLVGVRLAVKL